MVSSSFANKACLAFLMLAVYSPSFGAAVSDTDRQSIVFDYGWRFHFGDVPDGGPGPNSCSAFDDKTNVTCTNQYPNPNRFSPRDCMLACCYNPLCYTWTQENRHCYHGAKDSVCTTSPDSAAFGGSRSTVQPVRYKYEYATKDYDDSAWRLLDVPHDFISEQNYSSDPRVNNKHGSLPRNVSWYRKHFSLPEAMQGRTVVLHFEGVFHVATVFVNGEFAGNHTAGYTGFQVRLDNLTNIQYGDGSENVIAIRTDASFGSGHWYEGGGIYRPVHLISKDPVHFVSNGVFANPESDGHTAEVTVEMENHGSKETSGARVVVKIFSLDGTPYSTNSTLTSVSPGKTTTQTVQLSIAGLKMWSTKNPQLYKVQAILQVNSTAQADTVEVVTGFRKTNWNSSGFFLNDELVKFRGFSHHNSMSGVGVALAPRLYVFRAQTSKAVGANVWRMSHNPYVPSLYSILDSVGTVVWDENRDYGFEYAFEMHEMVKRDRSHPGVVIWSFCNEYECGSIGNVTGEAFRHAAKTLDPDRPVGANGMTTNLDVQGFSHSQNKTFIQWHQLYPKEPLVLSECCSCTSQRDAARDLPSCIREQNTPGLLPYVTGSLGVWTLFDYIGEPSGGWPHISSSFGQFDLAGFPKPHAYWYRANWASMMPASRPDRPNIGEFQVARVLSLLDSSFDGLVTVTSTDMAELLVNGKSLGKQSVPAGDAYTWKLPSTLAKNTDKCSFPVNYSKIQCHGLDHIKTATSASECEQSCCDDDSCAVWQYDDSNGCWTGKKANECNCDNKPECLNWVGAGRAPPSAPHVVTVNALDAQGNTVASHTVKAAQPATSGGKRSLRGALDVPSEATATGTKVILDGHDEALVTVSLVDADGVLVSDEPVNVTFSVISGPGRVVGTGGGDPQAHIPPSSKSCPTFKGFVRAVIRVTEDCTSTFRNTMAQIDLEGNKTTVVTPSRLPCSTPDIIVKAEVLGGSNHLDAVMVHIPTSSDVEKDGPMAAARNPKFTYTYMEDFDG